MVKGKKTKETNNTYDVFPKCWHYYGLNCACWYKKAVNVRKMKLFTSPNSANESTVLGVLCILNTVTHALKSILMAEN